MFTRIVEITAKSGKAGELSRTVNEKVISILRDQPGFVDEIVLVSDDNPDRVLALSFWKTRQDLEKYGREVFPRVNDVIRNLFADTPQVRTFEVTTSTVREIVGERAA